MARIDRVSGFAAREHHRLLVPGLLAALILADPTQAQACCGLGGGFVGPLFVPLLMVSVALLTLTNYVYTKVVGLEASLVRTLVSVGVFLASIYFAFFLPGKIRGEETGLLWAFLLPVFLFGYTIFFKHLHDATFAKALGFVLLGVVVFPSTTLGLFFLFDV